MSKNNNGSPSFEKKLRVFEVPLQRDKEGKSPTERGARGGYLKN